MFLRALLSSILLLFITLLLTVAGLTTWVAPTQARSSLLPVTPPPAPINAPFNSSTTSEEEGEAGAPITATQSITATSTASTATPSDSPFTLLPTVTPRPNEILLLPTATATTRPATIEPTPLALTPIAPPEIEPTPTLTIATTILLPTPTSTRPATPTATPTSGTEAIPTDSAISDTLDFVPATSFVTVTVPLPASYRAQGSFASQTVYTDSTIAQQQGNFSIVQAAALNAYASNQRYTLSTQRAVGVLDEINVYQIDDYIAVNYTGGNWMIARRDQGSNIVRAIQPITDLAVLFPRILDQAEFVGQEEIAGITALRYRIDDPTGQGARLIQPLLSLTGDIRSLKLEVWLAVPGGYVVAYNFQVELAGARVLDANGDEVRADQAVTWTYQMIPSDQPEPIAWPSDAPQPNAIPVPGFAAGQFPVPNNTELLTLVGGVPEWISTLTPVEIDSFYRTELFTLGWNVTGEGELLSASKEGTTFQLMITPDNATNGSRISILSGE